MRAVKFGVGLVGLVGALTIVPGGETWPPGLGWAQGSGPSPSAAEDARKRAEDLAKGATERFDELVGSKGKNAQGGEASGRPSDSLAEQVYAWVSGSGRHYQDLVRRMAEPLRLNPVEDAARRMAAEQRRTSVAGAGADAPRPMVVADAGLIEQGAGWVHRSGRDYQEMMRRLSVPAEPSGVIGASKPAAEDARKAADAKKAEDDARRVAGAKKAEEAKQAEEARRAAEAKKASDAKKAEDDARRVAEAKKVEEAKQAEDARRTAEAKKAADTKKAEDDARRVAEAKKAEEAKQAEDARRAAEAKKAADAKKGEDDARRVSEAKKAEEAKLAEDARRAAEAKKAADTEKAEDDARRVVEARKAEDDARRIAEVQKAADAKKAEEDARRAAEAKKVEEARQVAAKQVRDTQRAVSGTKVAVARKVSETHGARKTRKARTAEAKRKKQAARKAAAERRKYAWREPRAAGGRRSKARRARDCRFAGTDVALPGWYVVKNGDTLWKIASRHYHKGRLYRLIYEANAGRIDHPTRIYPCQRLYIPKVRWRRQ